MNKLIKNISTICLFLGTLVMTSCNDSVDYEPASSIVDGGTAYLSSSSTSFVFTPDVKQSFKINVHRASSENAETIQLLADNDKFEVPASVDFAAGENIKEVEIGFNIAIGTSETLNVAVAEENKYTYGITTLSLSVSLDYTWEKYGTGTYTSALFGESWPQEVLKAKEANVYKLPDCITKGYPFVFGLSEDGQSLTKWDIQPSGYKDSSYGMVYYLPKSMTRDGNTLNFIMNGLVAVEGGYGILFKEFPETLEMPK